MGARDAIARHNEQVRRKRDDRPPLTRQQTEEAARLAFGHFPDDHKEIDQAEWQADRFGHAVACLLLGCLLALGIIAVSMIVQR